MDTLFPSRWRAVRHGAHSTSVVSSAQRRRQASGGSSREREPSLARASSLMDDPLFSVDGERLGTVSELLIDVERGRVAYALMPWGGFMGLAERLIAIPFAALRLDAADGRWVLRAPRPHFAAAPVFDPAVGAAGANPGWHEAVHRHYGVAPYWLERQP